MPDGLPRPASRGRPGPRFPGSGLHGILTLANLVSFARLCAAPVAVWLALRDRLPAVFWLVLCASLSDALDGWLARRRGPTRLGAVLDPMADKALLISLVITLAALDLLPDFVAILVVFRDLLIVGGLLALLLSGHPVAIRPLWISKLNTFLQLALVAAALLSGAYGVVPPLALAALIWAMVATTLASGAAYVWKVARP